MHLTFRTSLRCFPPLNIDDSDISGTHSMVSRNLGVRRVSTTTSEEGVSNFFWFRAFHNADDYIFTQKEKEERRAKGVVVIQPPGESYVVRKSICGTTNTSLDSPSINMDS